MTEPSSIPLPPAPGVSWQHVAAAAGAAFFGLLGWAFRWMPGTITRTARTVAVHDAQINGVDGRGGLIQRVESQEAVGAPERLAVIETKVGAIHDTLAEVKVLIERIQPGGNAR